MPIKQRPGLVLPGPAAVLPPEKSGGRFVLKAKPGGFKMGGSEIGDVMKQIDSAYGNEVARFINSTPVYEDRIRTGIFSLDLALAGGFLTSRGSMLYGERSAGKSTAAILACIEAQRMYPDRVCTWIDIEGTFDDNYFIRLGGDPDRFIKIEPESGEHAVDIADAVSRSLETAIVVTDSIAMLVPMAELDASAEKTLPGIHARLVGNYLRKLNNAMLKERHRQHRVLILHINQFRMKIGVMWGDPRTLPGGKALEFCTTQQAEVKNKEHINDQGDIEYNEHSFKITKDKTGSRIREGKYKIVRSPEHNKGMPEGYIDQIKGILQAGERIGVVAGRYEIKGFGKRGSSELWQEYFSGEPEAYARCQIMILNAFRKHWGLATPD